MAHMKNMELKIYTAGPKHVKPPTEPEPFNFKTQQIVRKVLAPEKVILINFFLFYLKST